jgi:hypothetical protein
MPLAFLFNCSFAYLVMTNIKVRWDDLKVPNSRFIVLGMLKRLGFNPTEDERVPTRATVTAAMVERAGSSETGLLEMALAITPNRLETVIDVEEGKRIVHKRRVPIVVYFAAENGFELARKISRFASEVLGPQEKLREAFAGQIARHDPDLESNDDGFPRAF